jgi:hypothetical protein
MSGSQFKYNVNASELQKRNVDRLYKAEANLDRVNRNMEADVSKYQHGVLRHLLEESGNAPDYTMERASLSR